MNCVSREWEGSERTFSADSVVINLLACVLPYICYLFNGLKEVIKCHLKILACSFYFFSFTWRQTLQYKHNYLGTSSVWCYWKLIIWMGMLDSLSSPFFKEVILHLFALVMICSRDINEESSMCCCVAFCFISLKLSY